MLDENKFSRDNMNIRHDIPTVTSLDIILFILVMQYLNMYIKHISEGRRDHDRMIQ
jgi:hypothetical protein